MEWLIVALLCYWIGEHVGIRKGKKTQYEFRYVEGYRKGVNQIETEIEDLSKLPNKEILKRVKNFVKSKKGDK